MALAYCLQILLCSYRLLLKLKTANVEVFCIDMYT